MAFTMEFEGGERYIAPVIVGKLMAGNLTVLLSCFIFKRISNEIEGECESEN